MNKIALGLIAGAIAGCIDVIPMVFQRLPWQADASAFSLWVISGFLIASSNLKIKSIGKGILISVLVLAPCAILIAAQSPASLIPISAMTLVLGALLRKVPGTITEIPADLALFYTWHQ
jgi:hypothetical protein